MRILWIPHTGWQMPQRAHIFCRALAERHEVHVTDLWADFSTWRDYLSPRYLRNFTYRRYQDGPITVHGVPRVSPAIFSPRLRQLNERLFTALVSRLIERHRIDVVVGTFVVPPPRAPRLIFDLFDENAGYWKSYSGAATHTYADEIASCEAAYMRAADVVVAASTVLERKARRLSPGATVTRIPNGVDVARFAQGGGEEVRAKLRLRGRVVGMLGNHDKPQELDKVIAAARQFDPDQVTFLIAGRGKAVPAAARYVEQAGISNVVFHGFVEMAEAPRFIDAFDVGLCPYKKTPGADASSPMRLFSYAAAGVPTVCTDLDSVRDLSLENVVLVDDTADALAEGIRQALRLPRARPSTIADYDLPTLIRRYEAVLSGTACDERLAA